MNCLVEFVLVPLTILFFLVFMFHLATNRQLYPKEIFLKGLPFLGHTFHFKLSTPKELGTMSSNVYILQTANGFAHLFRDVGMCITQMPFFTYYTMFSASKLENVFKSSSNINKPMEYLLFHDWLGRGLISSQGDIWRSHRKLLTPAFHFKILDSFVPISYEHSELLIEQWRTHAEDQKPFDITPSITNLTMSILCETAMGSFKVNGIYDTSCYIESTNKVAELAQYRMNRPWLWPKLFCNISPTGRTYRKALNIIQALNTKIMSTRKEAILRQNANPQLKPANHRPCFLDILLKAHLNDPVSFSEEDIHYELNTFMLAGQDTTAVSIMWSLLMIGNDPNVQHKIAQELDQVLGEDCNRPITVEDLKKMNYLSCVVKETLRLYPSVPTIGRRVDADMNIDGIAIPKGNVIVILLRALHMDPEQFPDPERFDPDRFLPENSVGRHTYAYAPFSAGSRNCIGQKFAMNEVKICLANILRNYVVTAMDTLDKIPVSPEIAGRPAVPIRLIVKHRKSNVTS